MIETLDRQGFLDLCQRVLEPVALSHVARQVVDTLTPFNPRFAYYFNPHVVFTRIVEFSPAAQLAVAKTIDTWCAETGARLRQIGDGEFSRDDHLGGIPDGLSKHKEVYFETHSGTQRYLLHNAGMSFRVRVTMQNSKSADYAARVLLLLTRYPLLPNRLSSVRPDTYWKCLDYVNNPAFDPLVPIQQSLAASTAIPCVVECLVTYLDDSEGINSLLDQLTASNSLGPAYVVAHFQKESIKFDICKWRQDSVSGKMDPNWAYATLDRVSASLTGSVQPASSKWQDLTQIEVEAGPSAVLVATVAGMMHQLDCHLESQVDKVTTTYGRKIHRLLEEQGHPFGAGGI